MIFDDLTRFLFEIFYKYLIKEVLLLKANENIFIFDFKF